MKNRCTIPRSLRDATNKDLEIPETCSFFHPNFCFAKTSLNSDDALNDGTMSTSKRALMKAGKENTLCYGDYGAIETERGHNDSASKSRYFDIDVWAEKHGLLQYPKASKRERNEGLEGLDIKEENLQGLDTRGRTLVREDGSKTLVERWKGAPTANHHPTIKPVHLMSWLVRLVSKEGDTVLDPFTGSGTTGVACMKLQRKFMGIELNEEYIKIAEARIKASISPQLTLGDYN